MQDLTINQALIPSFLSYKSSKGAGLVYWMAFRSFPLMEKALLQLAIWHWSLLASSPKETNHFNMFKFWWSSSYMKDEQFNKIFNQLMLFV